MNFKVEQSLKRVYQYSLLLIAFFIPVHIRFTGVFMLTAALSWLVVNRFRFRFSCRKHFQAFFFLTALYFCYVVGMIYTANTNQGWEHVLLRTSMLLFPVIMLSTSKAELPARVILLKWFVAGCCCISVFILAHAGFVYYKEKRDIFFYSSLTEFLKINPTYLSMYVVFSMMVVANWLLEAPMNIKGKSFCISVAAFSMLMVILLLSREEMIALVAAVCMLLILHFAARRKIMVGIGLGLAVIIMLTVFFLSVPFTGQRFAELKEEWDVPYSNSHPTSINVRKADWEASLELISRHPVIGIGTGDVEDSLLASFKEKKLEWPLNDKLNAHNQFLQTTLSIGLIGFALLIMLLSFSLSIAIKAKDLLHIVFLILFFISTLTESMLEVEAGVLFFAFFNTVFVSDSLSGNGKKCSTI